MTKRAQEANTKRTTGGEEKDKERAGRGQKGLVTSASLLGTSALLVVTSALLLVTRRIQLELFRKEKDWRRASSRAKLEEDRRRTQGSPARPSWTPAEEEEDKKIARGWKRGKRKGQQEDKVLAVTAKLQNKDKDNKRTGPGHSIHRRGQRLWPASLF